MMTQTLHGKPVVSLEALEPFLSKPAYFILDECNGLINFETIRRDRVTPRSTVEQRRAGLLDRTYPHGEIVSLVMRLCKFLELSDAETYDYYIKTMVFIDRLSVNDWVTSFTLTYTKRDIICLSCKISKTDGKCLFVDTDIVDIVSFNMGKYAHDDSPLPLSLKEVHQGMTSILLETYFNRPLKHLSDEIQDSPKDGNGRPVFQSTAKGRVGFNALQRDVAKNLDKRKPITVGRQYIIDRDGDAYWHPIKSHLVAEGPDEENIDE